MTETTPMTSPSPIPGESPRARDIAALAGYVRVLADRMGLKDWTFEVVEVDDSTGNYGLGYDACEIDEPDAVEKHAEILVDPEFFFRRSPERRRVILTRQLLVCHASPLWRHIRERIGDDNISFNDKCRFEEEYVVFVTPIAKAWAASLPLPLVGLMRRAMDGAGEATGD